MRIVSLNCWGGRVHGPLMAYLPAVDADVFCLQEVVDTPGAGTGWLSYRDGDLELPQRANLFDEIAQVLPGHEAMFLPAESGDLFDGDRAFASRFGLATFVRRSLPVIAQATDFVHGGSGGLGWGAHPRARNAHCVRLHDRARDASTVVAHMHGLRDPEGKMDTPARDDQARRLVALIRRVWNSGESLVVAGDFNILPDSATFRILADLGLADLVTGRGFTDTRTSLYVKEGRYADYMLVTPDVEVTGFSVVGQPEVSDHRVLRLDIG